MWKSWKLFFNNEDYFASFAQDLRMAKHSVSIETYIFEMDPLTRELLSLLKETASKGVDVRLMVDGFGAYFAIDELRKHIENTSIQLKVFNPLPSSTRLLQKRFLFLTHFFHYFRKLNRRNHRKTILIDQDILYAGSLNWTQVHIGSSQQPAWRDSACRLEGSGVPIVQKHFDYIWEKSSFLKNFFFNHKNQRLTSNYDFDQIKMNTQFHLRFQGRKHLFQKIKTAQKRILITSAYFIPERKLLRALIRASRRGVDVQILVPGPTDVPLVQWAFEKIISSFLKAQIKIHQYKASVLHAKTMIIDDWAQIGSANLNHRSALHDLEIEVGFKQAEVLKSMEDQWLIDLKKSETLRYEDIRQRSFFKRLRSELAYRLRYLL